MAFDLLSRQVAAPAPASGALRVRLQLAALRLLLATILSTAGVRTLATQVLLEGLEP
jgi:hypothetical protein